MSKFLKMILNKTLCFGQNKKIQVKIVDVVDNVNIFVYIWEVYNVCIMFMLEIVRRGALLRR